MPDGVVLNLGGNNRLGSGDNATAFSTFTIDRVLGTGTVSYTAGFFNNGTRTGTYYLGTDGGVHFVPDTAWPTNLQSVTVQSAPDYGVYFGKSGNDTNLNGTAGDEVIYGGDTSSTTSTGNDTITANAGNDLVYGGGGNDVIYGGDGNDTLLGGAGSDSLYGGNGNDVLNGGGGNDSLFGGEGNDSLDGGIGNDVLDGGNGNDRVDGGAGNDTIALGEGDNTGFGGTGSDTITAGSGGDTIFGGAGRDSISAGAGSDTVYGGDSADTIDAGAGNDTIYGEAGNDSILGGDGDDLIYGDDSAPATVTTETLSWANQAAQNTDLRNGFTQDTGNINVSVSFRDDGSLTSTLNTNDTVYTGSSGIATNSSVQLLGTNGPTVTTVVDFAADPASGVADSVTNVGFWVTDIDAVNDGFNNFRDTISVVAYGPDGTAVPVVITVAGNDTLSGNTVTAAYSNDSPDQAAGAIYVTIAGPVSSFEVAFGNTGTTNHAVNLSDIRFTTMAPTAGDDIIDGGLGNDTLFGGGGNDTLTGGAGNDTLDGGAGNDYITGGTGDDTFYGGDGNDVLDDEPGPFNGTSNDLFYGGAGDDVIWTGGGNDVAYGGAGNDYMNGEEGNNTLFGDGGNDYIVGGTGNDTLYGGTGDDYLYGGNGGDLISGGDGNDILSGDAGNDTLMGDAGNDTLFGGDGNDTLNGGTGTDTLYGDAGNDTLSSLGGGSLYGGAGSDAFTLASGTPAQLIDGGEDAGDTDTDTLSLTATSPGTGATVTFSGAEAGTITFGGSAASHTFTGIEQISTTAFDDTINASASAGAVNVSTGAGDDTVQGSEFDDTLNGGSGADTIDGRGGNDTIDVGANDGETDVLILQDGFGDDLVTGFEAPIDNGDGTFTPRDQFDVTMLTDANGDPVNVNDVVTSDDGSGNTLLSFPNGESVLLMGVPYVPNPSPFYLSAFGIPLPDGTVSGTAGDDTIDAGYTGDPDGDMVDANDAILPGDTGNDDLIEAGAGNDTVHAGEGNDHVFGGSGDDTLFGEGGDDTIEGDDGFDTLYGGDGNDTLYGGFGSGDEIYGGAGDDVIETGFDGGDSTAYGGDGNDQIVDFGSSTGTDTFYGGAGNDDILGSFGNDVIYAGTGDDFAVGGEGDDTFMVEDNFGWDFYDGGTTGETEGDTLDARAVTVDTVLTLNSGHQGNLSDTASLDDADPSNDNTIDFFDIDRFFLGSGNDTVFGAEDDDVVDLGAGDDVFKLFNVFGNDTVTGGEAGETAGDTLDGSGLTDDVTVNFSAPETGTVTDGSSTTSFSEIETVRTGAGNDSITGSAGNDTVFAGAGNDTLNGGGGDDSLSGEDGDDRFVVTDGFGNDVIDGGAGGETDGDTLDLSAVTAGLTLDLTNANPETGTVTDGTDTISFQEIEHITLGAGNDTLILANNGGADRVDGFAIPVSDGSGGWTGVDMLDVTGLTRNGTDPITTADVTVSDDGNGNAVLGFPDGTSLTLNGVSPAAVSAPGVLAAMGIPEGADGIVSGTAGDDFIDDSYLGDPDGDRVDNNDATLPGATGNDDRIEAGAGNDIVYAGEGNDLVYAGDGDDVVYGGAGNDIINGEAGNDSLSGGAGDDTLVGGAGSDTFFVSDAFGNDVITGGEDAGDTDVDLIEAGSLTQNVTVTFSADETGTMTNGTDTISFSGIEDLHTGSGDDIIYGGIGGNGIVWTGAGNDTAFGGAGNDFYNLGDGDNFLFGGDGDDFALAGSGNDVLYGGAGMDYLSGGDGDDTLDGGTGADRLYAGQGNDTVIFGRGDQIYGDDPLESTGGDDLFILTSDPESGPAPITIYGGSNGTTGDTLQLGSGADLSTLNITGVSGDSKSGTVELRDGSLVTFWDIENIICFTPGTLIATPHGTRDIASLQIGDLVMTRDHGLQPIRWIQSRTVPAIDRFAPVLINPGVVTGLDRPLLVSPQHRMLFQGYRAELLFGESEVLVAAKHLIDGRAVTRQEGGEVTYIHMLFDQHEIIYAEGAATESFHPGDVGFNAIHDAGREELFAIFPELRSDVNLYGNTARRCLKRHEAELLRV